MKFCYGIYLNNIAILLFGTLFVFLFPVNTLWRFIHVFARVEVIFNSDFVDKN